MKIVYFGSDVFLDVFRFLQRTQEILALYTYHNDEDYFNEGGIVRLAHMNGIGVHYEQPTEAEMTQWIERDGCELFVVAEYSHKLPVPHNNAFRGINFHSSVLPEGRSYYPIECGMQNGLDYGGVTAHKLASQLDRGDILSQRKFPVSEKDDSVDIYLYCAHAAREMVEEIFSDFETCWAGGTVQEVKLPYWKRPDLAKMMLGHSLTVTQACEVYRTFNKMTMVTIDGEAFYVDGFSTGNARIGRRDGDIIFVRDNRVLYGVTDGHLRLDIQPVPPGQGG